MQKVCFRKKWRRMIENGGFMLTFWRIKRGDYDKIIDIND